MLLTTCACLLHALLCWAVLHWRWRGRLRPSKGLGTHWAGRRLWLITQYAKPRAIHTSRSRAVIRVASQRTRLPWLWLCGVFTRFCSCSSYFLLLLLLAVAHLTIWPFATLFRLATINTQLVFPAIAAIQPALWEKRKTRHACVCTRVLPVSTFGYRVEPRI